MRVGMAHLGLESHWDLIAILILIFLGTDQTIATKFK